MVFQIGDGMYIFLYFLRTTCLRKTDANITALRRLDPANLRLAQIVKSKRMT